MRNAAVPVHFEDWTHFTQGADALRAAFAGNGVADRLMVPERGAVIRAYRHGPPNLVACVLNPKGWADVSQSHLSWRGESIAQQLGRKGRFGRH